MIEMRLEGLDVLDRKLQEFPLKVQRVIAGKAAYEGAKLFRQAARETAPVGTREHWVGKKGTAIKSGPGYLKRHISMMRMPGKPGWYLVGVSRGSWYGRLLEFGWTPTGPRKKGMSYREHRATAAAKGHAVSGRHWLKKAFDGTVREAIEAIQERFSRLVEEEAGK
jgi:hypothetical protein